MKARFEPFTDLLLERYLAGELDGHEARRVEDAAAKRPELKQYLQGRRADREAFKLKRPPLKLPAEPLGWPAWRWGATALALGAAALLLVVVVPRAPPSTGIAMRGEARVGLSVAVQRGAEVFAYRDGVVLLPRDRIRLTVKAPEPGYLTIVAQDARGEALVLYEAVRVEGETTLADSLELDDTPGTEELFVFFGPTAVRGAVALDGVRKRVLGDATVVKLSKGGP